MSLGWILLIGTVLGFGGLFGMQWWMMRHARKAEGTPAPQLPGELGEAIRGSVLLWFHSPSCGPCKVMEPHVQALGDKARIIDVSRDPNAARAFNVMATPTTIRITDGQIERVQLGMVPPDALAAMAP